MKKTMAFVCFWFASTVVWSEQPNLIIKIIDLKSTHGCINIAFYNNKEPYNQNDINRVVYALKEKVFSASMELLVYDLSPDNYAFKAFQDSDCSGTLQKNWLGIPKNAFRFSNNTRSLKFDKAKFKISAVPTMQVIKLQSVF